MWSSVSGTQTDLSNTTFTLEGSFTRTTALPEREHARVFPQPQTSSLHFIHRIHDEHPFLIRDDSPILIASTFTDPV